LRRAGPTRYGTGIVPCGRLATVMLCVTGILAASSGAALAEESTPEPNAAPRTEPALEWQAPPGCPEREQVLALVAALAHDDAVQWQRFDAVRGRVSPRSGMWLLDLDFVRPSGVSRRRVESGRCADLAQAAAVAIVLAHRADEASGASWTETEPMPGGFPPSGPPASAPVEPAEPIAALEPNERASGEPLALALGARGVLDPTTLGEAALGVALGLDVELGPWSLGVSGVLFPAVETSVAPGQAIALGLTAAGARGCRRWVPGLRTCIGMELGQLRAASVALEQPSSARDPWLTPSASLELWSQPLAALAITADAALLAPLVRGEYRVDEREVHRVPALAVRAGLGLRVQLLP